MMLEQPRITQARSRLSREDGIALPIAIMVLLIALVLAAVATAVAVDTNGMSNRDTNAKVALEAANAGVNVAIYRLNSLQPAGSYCPTAPTSVAVGSTGAPTATLCPQDGPESLGNGASFEYWVSRVLQTGDTCVGPAVDNTQSTIAQRCITAVGTKNGVQARVQERVAAYTSTPVFPAAIFGTKSVTISNNATITTNNSQYPALLGTNGVLSIGGQSGGGTTVVDGYRLPPGASLQMGQNVTNNGPTTGQSTPYPVPTPQVMPSTVQNTAGPPYDSTLSAQDGTCLEPSTWTGTWTQTNCNYRISQGITYPSCSNAGIAVSDCDPSNPVTGITFDPVGRTLTVGNNTSLTLGGGFYNFCSLTLGNNALIQIAPNAKVSIYIDSPADPGSQCAAGTGTFTMNQNSAINPGGDALNAQIYVYGDPNNTPPQNTVNMTNNSSSAFSLSAPNSIVNMNPSSNTTFTGAISGYSVTIGNASNFTYQATTNTLQTGSLQQYFRSFYEQCPTTPSNSSDPTSGC